MLGTGLSTVRGADIRDDKFPVRGPMSGGGLNVLHSTTLIDKTKCHFILVRVPDDSHLFVFVFITPSLRASLAI